jgi:hypothetical protein
LGGGLSVFWKVVFSGLRCWKFRRTEELELGVPELTFCGDAFIFRDSTVLFHGIVL